MSNQPLPRCAGGVAVAHRARGCALFETAMSAPRRRCQQQPRLWGGGWPPLSCRKARAGGLGWPQAHRFVPQRPVVGELPRCVPGVGAPGCASARLLSVRIPPWSSGQAGGRTMDSTGPGAAAVEALERLGAELGARGYQTHLITAHDSEPWLAVRNPHAAMLSEKVSALRSSGRPAAAGSPWLAAGTCAGAGQK
jgi:hypothetical protein